MDREDGAKSPSLRTPNVATRRAVRKAFESCAELPALLVEAVANRRQYWEQTRTYLQLSRAFREASLAAIASWCKERAALFEKVCALGAGLNGPRSVGLCAADYAHHEHLGIAFGYEACEAYGERLVMCSHIDARTFVAVQNRRCVLCGGHLSTISSCVCYDGGVTSFSLCFAHQSCQARHCLRTRFPLINQFFQRMRGGSIVARVLYGANAPFVWVEQHPAVDPACTLYGCLREDDAECTALKAECTKIMHSRKHAPKQRADEERRPSQQRATCQMHGTVALSLATTRRHAAGARASGRRCRSSTSYTLVRARCWASTGTCPIQARAGPCT